MAREEKMIRRCLNSIGGVFRTFFCKHEWEFWRNVYGDEINFLDCRSLYTCKKCGLLKRAPELVDQECHPEAHTYIKGVDFCLRCRSKK